ncbi:hypothetical protein FEDK69T_27660 [Flavobacterium enshiense DK69]|uniref:Sensor of ECF-type sigma factor n=1 Tax=Flavobacterium enshiense DK69 TaxID=1107311 RepID=V6S1J1_9FLAO|nr:hypothetical protein [Flavobacterium enshiense]ESU20254.1 hypothetical protein FEDK69T_27660 [Flavobacterium enshiense DK69]KGO95932.1 sensor of ECF-type sigma factor [Flavobacterium enshiense DK69]
MTLKKFLPIVFLLISTFSFAQPSDEKREQIKQLKVAFITTELDLSKDEAEKFWPIYNTFEEKQFEMRHEKMRSFKKRMDKESVDKMSEKEAAALLAQMEDNEEKMLQLRKKLSSDLRPVIGSVKILKLRKAEDDFNRKLIKQIKESKK